MIDPADARVYDAIIDQANRQYMRNRPVPIRSPVSDLFERADGAFFKQHPERQAHMRLPHESECKGEFWSLGEHNRTRRRIILWRIPPNHPQYSKLKAPLMKIPFLAFADEAIEDTDDILLPLIHSIMEDAAKQHGVEI